MAAQVVGWSLTPRRQLTHQSDETLLLGKIGAKRWDESSFGVSGSQTSQHLRVQNRVRRDRRARVRDREQGQALQAEVEGAVAAGVTGTPSFFVNGRRVSDHSLEALSAAIDPLIRAR